MIALAGGPAVGAYWAIAGPAGAIVTGLYYRRRERLAGLEGLAAPYAVTAVVVVVACIGVGALGSGLAAIVGPSLVVGLGLLVFARLDRSPALAGLGAGLAAAAAGLAVADADPERAGTVLAVGVGVATLAVGLAYRRVERGRA